MAKLKPTCSFCGRDKDEAGPLVEGETPGADSKVYICKSCITDCTAALDKEHSRMLRPQIAKQFRQLPSPAVIYEHLGQYVIGQEIPKKKLSVQVVKHYRRLLDSDMGQMSGSVPLVQQKNLEEVEIEKSNMLLIGPTGCGKTLLAKSLAAQLQVPIAIGDATTLTEAGYVGEDVENLLLKLLVAADFDVEVAQRGIIYIDEIDKIGKTGGNVSITRDVSGEGVQQSLLKLIEGTIANVPPQGGRKHPEQQYVQIDTTNILFICGGAFNGLDEIIGRRLNRRSLGFGATLGAKPDETEERNALLAQVTPEDLIEFGLIPEFIGRLPVVAALEELSVDDLVRVLTEPKNALLRQEQKTMAYMGVDLQFTPEAIRAIAKQAKEKGTGARGLRAVLEEFMYDVHFNLPASTKIVIIDEEVVNGKKLFLPRSEAA